MQKAQRFKLLESGDAVPPGMRPMALGMARSLSAFMPEADNELIQRIVIRLCNEVWVHLCTASVPKDFKGAPARASEIADKHHPHKSQTIH
jgi:hypothetical protein